MISSMIYAASFLLAFASIHAIPLRPRDVVAPPLITPDASTVWNVGETVTVTWNTSVIPSGTPITNPDAMLVLGYSTWQNENLDLDNPLVQNVSILAGQATFVVPSVPTRSNYIVCLFGDSGDISSNFTIIGASSSSSAVPSASPAASSALAASSGILAESTSSSQSVSRTASSSGSITITTQVTTSVSLTTIPGIPTSSSSAGRSAGTSYAGGSVTVLPTESAPLSSGNTGSSVSLPSSSASTSVSGNTSGAWSWKSTSLMHSWPLGFAIMATFLML